MRAFANHPVRPAPPHLASRSNVAVEGGLAYVAAFFSGLRSGVRVARSEVRRLERIEDAAPDHFLLEASLDTWREMIENIQTHGAPDLKHTLNYLTFPDDPMLVSSPDQLQIDAFYRYNQSLQRFFNGAAQVAISYPQ